MNEKSSKAVPVFHLLTAKNGTDKSRRTRKYWNLKLAAISHITLFVARKEISERKHGTHAAKNSQRHLLFFLKYSQSMSHNRVYKMEINFNATNFI